jgi:hypothetical protein
VRVGGCAADPHEGAGGDQGFVHRRGRALAGDMNPLYRKRAAPPAACATRRATSDERDYVRGNPDVPGFHLPGGYSVIRRRPSEKERQRRSGRCLSSLFSFYSPDYCVPPISSSPPGVAMSIRPALPGLPFCLLHRFLKPLRTVNGDRRPRPVHPSQKIPSARTLRATARYRIKFFAGSHRGSGRSGRQFRHPFNDSTGRSTLPRSRAYRSLPVPP